MEEYGRKNKEEIHKELQDLDPMGSPHKEEKVIGGNIELDLPSLFPQRYARIMGGIERRMSFPRSTMEGERGEKRAPRVGVVGEEAPLNRSPKIQPLQPKIAQERYYRCPKR
jgi:hypothetical protein